MSSALPKQVFIIRHGEKPGDPCAHDSADGPNLSTRGYERAGALAAYVTARFKSPDFLFATQASDKSNRPVETITPLSQAIKIKIDDEHADAEFDQVATDILKNGKYAGKQVLICWHHGNIPALTIALGGVPPLSKWPCAVFDRVWQIDYPTDGSSPTNLPVQNLPQDLLDGDDSA